MFHPSKRPRPHSARTNSLWYIDHHESPTDIVALTLNKKDFKK
jgi:hypothetical protein